MCDLHLDAYSEKSFVLYGNDTIKYKDTIKQLGGRYNNKLKSTLDKGGKFKGGPGWIFSNKKQSEIENWITNLCQPKTVLSPISLKKSFILPKTRPALPSQPTTIGKSKVLSPVKSIKRPLKRIEVKSARVRRQVKPRTDILALPKNIRSTVALELPLKDLLNLCLTNKEFAKICDEKNNVFWMTRLKEYPMYKFPQIPCGFTNWKEVYIYLQYLQKKTKSLQIGSIIQVIHKTDSRRGKWEYSIESMVLDIAYNKKGEPIEITYVTIPSSMNIYKNRIHIYHGSLYERGVLFFHKTKAMKAGRWLSRQEYNDMKENQDRIYINSLEIQGFKLGGYQSNEKYPTFLYGKKCKDITPPLKSQIQILNSKANPHKEGTEPEDHDQRVTAIITDIEYNFPLYGSIYTLLRLDLTSSEIVAKTVGQSILLIEKDLVNIYYIDDLKILDDQTLFENYIRKYHAKVPQLVYGAADEPPQLENIVGYTTSFGISAVY